MKVINYSVLDTYKSNALLVSFCCIGLTVKRPDFMCVTKRKSGEQGWSTKKKHVKLRSQMKKKDRHVHSVSVRNTALI